MYMSFFAGLWGIENGKEALAAGGPPPPKGKCG